LSQRGNGYAARCSQAFYRRLTDTADLSQLILGYLVTREAVLWYRSLAPHVVGGCALSSAGEVDRLTGPLLDHFREFLFATDGPAFHHAWRVYLAELDFPEG
jgi:hypothetical protein